MDDIEINTDDWEIYKPSTSNQVQKSKSSISKNEIGKSDYVTQRIANIRSTLKSNKKEIPETYIHNKSKYKILKDKHSKTRNVKKYSEDLRKILNSKKHSNRIYKHNSRDDNINSVRKGRCTIEYTKHSITRINQYDRISKNNMNICIKNDNFKGIIIPPSQRIKSVPINSESLEYINGYNNLKDPYNLERNSSLIYVPEENKNQTKMKLLNSMKILDNNVGNFTSKKYPNCVIKPLMNVEIDESHINNSYNY